MSTETDSRAPNAAALPGPEEHRGGSGHPADGSPRGGAGSATAVGPRQGPRPGPFAEPSPSSRPPRPLHHHPERARGADHVRVQAGRLVGVLAIDPLADLRCCSMAARRPRDRAATCCSPCHKAGAVAISLPIRTECSKALCSLQRRREDWCCGVCGPRLEPCSGCGKPRPVACRDRRGRPLCLGCWPKTLRTRCRSCTRSSPRSTRPGCGRGARCSRRYTRVGDS